MFTLSMVIMVAVLSLSSCKKQQAPTENNNYPVLEISLTDKSLSTEYTATIEGRQDVDVYPQISGTITRVCVNEGARVVKGQILFVIDQVPYKAAVETAKANVQSAKAAVATAQMTVESKEELYQSNVVSSFDLQSARNSLSQQQASLAQAEAQYTTARNNLSYTEVKSPVDGVIGMISYRVGSLVSSAITTPLVSVSDCDEMYVYFSLTETALLSLTKSLGQEAKSDSMPHVKLRLSDGTLYSEEGRIDAISGLVDKHTGGVTLRAVFKNPSHLLRSGSQGRLILPIERKGCIVIPQASTYEIQDKVFVYKVIQGKTVSSPVTVLDMNDGKNYVVESGLSQGDVIVADGVGMLSDGMAVQASPSKTAAK